MTNLKNDNLIKNSAIIAISNKITLLQRKLFNFLIAHSYIYLNEKESFEIKISDLKYRLWFDSKNIEYLKESLKQLISTVVEFNLLWKDKDSWSATALLSSVEFEEGKCIYSFSPVLRKKLHQPHIYAKLKLSIMKLFSSKYSLCLYEIFVDYKNIWQTPVISLDDFRRLMWIEKNQYKEFKRLSIRIIKPAIKELNSIWWYEVKVVYKKESRKVIALKFFFSEIKNKKEILKQEKIIENTPLQKRLIQDFWLTLRQAQSVIKTYPIPYIKESLEIIRLKIAQKTIKNIPAYTITVLKNDYTLIPNKQEKPILSNTKENAGYWKTNSNRLEDSKSATGINLLHNANNNSIPKNQTKAKKYFEELSKEEQKKLIKKFEDEKITSDILITLYKKEWLDSTVFKVMFYGFIDNN